MSALRPLDAERAAAVEQLCELIVPGSRPGRPGGLRRRAAGRDAARRARACARGDRRAGPRRREGRGGARRATQRTPEFAFVRALAVEAYYSDFVAPGAPGPGAWAEIDFNSPAGDASRQGLVLPGNRMKDEFEVVVVGSGAGGGVVAGELAQRGRDVLLLETGPHLTAADFTRWEAKATHDLFWPLRLAHLGNGEMLAFLAGRCVGGTTTINTKVALRAHERDVAKWHPATALTNERGEPFGTDDLAPYYDRVEQALGVRERSDWRQERLHGREGVPRARSRARARAVLHRRQLHELRLLPPGLPDERRQVDREHLHRRRVGPRTARAAGECDGGAGPGRGRGGDRRLLHGR